MKTFKKALVAAAVALAGALGASLSDGNLTVTEGLVVLGAGLVAGSATYKVKNETA